MLENFVAASPRTRKSPARRAVLARRPVVEGMEGRQLLTSLAYVNTAYATEYGTGDTTMNFNITLASPATAPVTLQYQTSNGTATAGTDYVASTGTVTIPAGQSSATVPVTILPDTAAPGSVSFGFTLSNPKNAIIISGNATGVITELNAANPPTLAINNASVTRSATGTTTMAFQLSLSYAYTSPITVTATTGGITAISGVDFQAETSQITFEPGQTTATFDVTVLGSSQTALKLLKVTLGNATTSTGQNVPLNSTSATGIIYPI